ncbi:MAG: hypothetical protein Q8Q60_00545 [Candidatus Chromulinivorax sp.]|nr:hypothetical protein [Candidatus Chromulinivorax sp.]
MNIKNICLFYLALTTTTYASQQIVPEQSEGNTIIHITVNGASNSQLTQKNNLDQQADHDAAQSTDTKANATTIIKPELSQQFYDFYQKQLQNTQQSSVNAINWMQGNKIKTICITILSSYSYISYQIYRSNLIINDPNSWSNWNNSRSLNDLFAASQSKLESDVLFSIQTRYVHPTNPTDFIYSIVQASNSLQEEIQTVQGQISRYTWINRCRSMELFFITLQDLESLQEKLRKLLFIKHVFASWCANYKIDKNRID